MSWINVLSLHISSTNSFSLPEVGKYIEICIVGGHPGGRKSIAIKLEVILGNTVTNLSHLVFQSIIAPPLARFFVKGSSVSNRSSELKAWQYEPRNRSLADNSSN